MRSCGRSLISGAVLPPPGAAKYDPQFSGPQRNAGGKILEAALANIRRGVTDPQSLEARHDLSCAAPAHTEEFLYRRAVEVSGCHGTQGGRGFRQVDETRLVGRARESSCSTTC